MTRAQHGGQRIGGRAYAPGDDLPERYARAKERLQDPAGQNPLLAPNLGRFVVPQLITFSGMSTTLAKAYRNADEAYRHSVENAHMMLTDPTIAGPLHARQMMTSLLQWSIESEDDKDPRLKAAAATLQTILEKTPRFTELRRSLLEAIWYGRSATQHAYGFYIDRQRNRMRVIKKWLPVSGDKLLFRYDDGSYEFDPDQIGVRVAPVLGKQDSIAGRRELEATTDGMGYFLKPWERRHWCVHKHMIRDGEYEDPLSSGQIHGVGLRHFLYWTWYQKQETMAQVVEMVERTGMGITIYFYPLGNAEAEEQVKKVAHEQAHTNILAMPYDPATGGQDYQIQQIPPNTAGLQILTDIVDHYYGDMITRFILGQTLSSKPSATGMNTGVADLQKDSLYDIVRYDAVNLQESITREILIPLRDFNLFQYRSVEFFFKISTKVSAPQEELAAIQQAWSMGAKIRYQDLFAKLDLAMPAESDKVVFNPQLVQAIQQVENPSAFSPPQGGAGPQPPGATPSSPDDGSKGQNEPLLGGDEQPQQLDKAIDPRQDREKLFGPILYDRISGGLADGQSDSQFSDRALAQGQRVEMEHTNQPAIAKEIAKDHLAERGDYYDRLARMERYSKRSQYLARIQEAVEQTEPNPSPAQKEAGNYSKGLFHWHGLEIAIETPKGQRRRPEWPALQAHYGYIRRHYDPKEQRLVTSESCADGDHLDVFIGPHPESEIVYVIDQTAADGKWDEHKVILGCTNKRDARDLYLSNYADGWKCGPIRAMTISTFKHWVHHGDLTKPVANQKLRYARQLSLFDDTFSRAYKPKSLFDENAHPRATEHVEIEGKAYEGGQWIPKDAAAEASPQAQEKIEVVDKETGASESLADIEQTTEPTEPDSEQPETGSGGSEPEGRVDDGESGSAGDLGANPVKPPEERIVTARAKHTTPADRSLVPEKLRQHLDPHQLEGVAKAIASMDKHGGYITADGCVAAETRIFDPISGCHTPIADLSRRGKPIRVLSLTPAGFEVRWATCPFEKGIEDLYRVTTDSGRSLLVTGRHRFLTPDGWLHAEHLSAGCFLASAEGPAASDLGFAPLVHGEGDQRWNRTPEDCLDGYSGDCRLCGELCVDNRPDVDAQRHDSQGISQCSEGWLKTSHSVLSQTIQSDNHPPHARTDQELVSCGHYSRWDRVRTIEYVRTDVYYDMYVPGTENYVAEGLVHHNTGVGKTRQLLATAQHYLDQGKNVLVIAPKGVTKADWKKKTVTGSWQNDSQAMGIRLNVTRDEIAPNVVNISSYENLAKLKNLVDGDTVLLWDECFPADTPVLTDQGLMPIGKIVNERLPVRVASMNCSTNVIEWKRITQYHKNRLKHRFVTIRHTDGELRCTEFHRIWVEGRGYVAAKDLRANDELRVVRQAEGFIRQVRHSAEVLQHQLLGSLAYVTAGYQVKMPYARSKSKAIRVAQTMAQHAGREGVQGGIVTKDGRSQSYALSRRRLENDCHQRGQRNFEAASEGSWRQWDINEATVCHTGPSSSTRSSMECGIAGRNHSLRLDCRPAIPHELQARHWALYEENWDRSRRQVAQLEAAEGEGSEKRQHAVASWVEGVEIHESGDRHQGSGSGEDDSVVYCLEVEDNHNFFASGILVSNSHALKNYASARSEHGTAMADKAHAVLFATATPVDKVEHLHYLDRAGVFGDRFYGRTYEQLGLEQVEQRTTNGTVKKWQIRPGVKASEVMRRLSGLFDRLTADGKMLKREISMEGVPVRVEQIKLPAEAHELLQRIEEELTGTSANAGLERARILMHQRRQQEPYKVPHAVDMALDAVQQGRQVVIFASRVNESRIGDEDDEDAISSEGTMKLLKEELERRGVKPQDIAEIHGGMTKSKIPKEMDRFQNGQAKVVIATVESGGTGINLDDTKGDAPRTLIMMTAPFSAVENVQAVGRVWRLKTKSVPDIRYLFADTEVDDWNAALIGKKMQTLGASVSGQVGKLDVTKLSEEDAIDYEPEDPFVWNYPGEGEPPVGTFTRLDNGDWGLRVEGRVKPGDVVDVTKRDGSRQRQTVAKVVTSGRGFTVATISSERPKQPAPATEADRPPAPPPPLESPAPQFSPEKKAAIHAAIRSLADMDEDRAREVNNMGFGKFDGQFGHQLAQQETLTDRQAAAAEKLVNKYRRQLPESLLKTALQQEQQPKAPAPKPTAAPSPQAHPFESLAAWSAPKKVNTSQGPRIVRSAVPGKKFWDAWGKDKEKLKRQGIGVTKYQGEWQINWWQEESPERHAKRYQEMVAAKYCRQSDDIPHHVSALRRRLEYLKELSDYEAEPIQYGCACQQRYEKSDKDAWHLHTLGHLSDEDYQVSRTPQWESAWQLELSQGQLSEDAAESPVEGLAGYVALVLRSPAEARNAYPLSWQAIEEAGMLE